MHIYAFIVLSMQLNAFLVYIFMYTHIFAHITHISKPYYMKIPHKDNGTYNMHMREHSMDTRVDFLHLARLRVTGQIYRASIGQIQGRVSPSPLLHLKLRGSCLNYGTGSPISFPSKRNKGYLKTVCSMEAEKASGID